MTDDERKAWDENLEDCKLYISEYGPEPRCTAILAANAELKKCHEIMEREGKELIHLRIVTESQNETIKRLRDRCNEYAETVDLLEQKADKLREALSCNSKNCSEFGYIHDGDCFNCPQGTIRSRAGIAATKEEAQEISELRRNGKEE